VSRNRKAIWALVAAVAALAVLAGGLLAAGYSSDVGLYQAIPAVPLGLVLGFLSLRLARGARFEHQRTLGRIGGSGLAAAARILGGFAFLAAMTGALALGVFAVLMFASR
jgi:hypothetical protein